MFFSMKSKYAQISYSFHKKHVAGEIGEIVKEHDNEIIIKINNYRGLGYNFWIALDKFFIDRVKKPKGK